VPVRLRAADVDLAHRCVLGERSAQDEVFRQQREHVHGTLYRILGSNADMDDLIQETFIEIFRSMASFRGEALLSTWVDRIAVRVAFAHIRRRRAEGVRLSVVPELRSEDASVEERLMAREAARRLYAILDSVEERQRVAYTLHVIDGRSLEEVARIMEASVVTTKVRSWRAARYVEKRAKSDRLLSSFLRREA